MSHPAHTARFGWLAAVVTLLFVGAVGCGSAEMSDGGGGGGTDDYHRSPDAGASSGGGFGGDAYGSTGGDHRADSGIDDDQSDDSDDDDNETWKRSKIIPHASRIEVGNDRKLEFSGLRAHVRIDGFRARVLLDYYFYNPDQQQYEGTFKVRLPNGGSPYFLAYGASEVTYEPGKQPNFDDSKEVRQEGFAPDAIMKDREEDWIDPKKARIVPKQRAARAYKQEVNKQIDPALAEWAGPGIFNARLFPIQGQKMHRVVFGYDVNLTRIDDRLEYRFPVPQNVGAAQVDIEVANLEGTDVSFEPKTVAITGDQNEYGFYKYTDPKENKVAKVRIDNVGTAALTGADPETTSYFATRFRPDIEKTKAANPTERAVFLVDVSMTSNPDRFNIWRKLMRAVLDENRGQLSQFAVVFFNVETFWWKTGFVENSPANIDSLMSYVDSLALEGASDIGAALEEASAPDWNPSTSNYDLFLLSDGNPTWGEEDQFALSEKLGGHELFAYRTDLSGENTKLLRHLSRESGGAVFSVVGEDQIGDAATAHTYQPWSIRGVDVSGASDLLLGGRPATLFPGQRLLLVGRGSVGSSANVDLQLQRGSEQKTVTTPIDHTVDTPLAPRAYGQIAVGQLETFLGSTRRFAEAYARQFRVARKSSSLLMLESEEAYREYDIKPTEDAKLVRDNHATDLVDRAVRKLRDLLGSAKQSFLDWVDELEKTRGVNLEPSDAFRTLLTELSEKHYEVDAEPLDCEAHTWQAVGSMLEKQLKERKPEYDIVYADAQRRKEKYGSDDALKALSTLVEAHPGRGVTARDVGFTAMKWGHYGHAYSLFQKVAHARPFEPQTYHQAALNLDEAGRPNLSMVYFELALSGNWDERFGSFEKIVRYDYLRFLRTTPDSAFIQAGRDLAHKRRTSLGKRIGVDEADMVVTLTWNTDNTDIDLHVVEPSGEEVYYDHRTSESTGGKLTEDVTEGFGPEMYVLEDAPAGDYEVFARYYNSNDNRSGTRTKVYATIYRNWGTKDERVIRKTVALEREKEDTDIATLSIK